jgi:molybdate transport system substrate-binding protein
MRAASVAALLAACSGPGAGTAAPSGAASGAPPGSAEALELTIFGAASLAAALDDVQAAYEAANPGVTLVVTTDSSAALATQIEQGAYADVFLSADTANAQRLVDGGFAGGDPIAFAGNELAIIVPPRNDAEIESWADLAEGHRIIAAGEAVPITRYATELVANLAARADAPAGFAAAYAASIVSREDNVRAVVAKIELGEGDAAIVYVTDARASANVVTVEVPEDSNIPATYAGVVLRGSDEQQPAEAFLDWLAGPGGYAILRPFGFLPPPR